MILIDSPAWPAHGRTWSHLVSDTSLDELHAFAARHGVPRRGFERDHYDVPAELYHALVAAGARPVSSREIVQRLEAAGLRRRKAVAPARRAAGNDLLRPRRLASGDLVAVPATAGVVPAERLAAGIARLESWGLRVTSGPHVLDVHPALGYLAGSDDARAADLTGAWLNPDVAAVVAARGGYGTQRILDLLDWKRLAEAEPKVLVGFSDVTALHQAFAARLGLVTVHSHVATSLGDATETSAEGLRRLLMDPEPELDLFAAQGDKDELTTVVAGVEEGVLVGGNLSLLASEVGTPDSRPASGGIVVLEEVGEAPYRIDRMLSQLQRSGWFDGVAGIVLGQFTDCGDPGELTSMLLDRLLPLEVPMIMGADIGHTDSTLSVPLGVRARLDSGALTLRLMAPALT